MQTTRKMTSKSINSLKKKIKKDFDASVFESEKLLKEVFVTTVSDLYTQNSKYDGRQPFEASSFSSINIIDNNFVVGTVDTSEKSVSYFVMPLKNGAPVKECMELSILDTEEYSLRMKIFKKPPIPHLYANVCYYNSEYTVGVAGFDKDYDKNLLEEPLDVRNPDVLLRFMSKCHGLEDAQKNNLVIPQ